MVFILDDTEVSLPAFSEVCIYCLHLDSNGERKCSAFPGGIPLPIWLGENDHRQPYAGNHGIRFSPVSDAAAVQHIASLLLDKRTPVKGKPQKRRLPSGNSFLKSSMD